MDLVQRVGNSTIVSLLNISVDNSNPIFQLETGQVVRAAGVAAYEPQRLIVSGSVLLAIYDLIGQHVDELRRIEETNEEMRKPQSTK